MIPTSPTPKPEKPRSGTPAYGAALAAGKERPNPRDTEKKGEARDVLHSYLDALGSRVPTAEELARLGVLAMDAFTPRSAATRTLAAFIRYIEAQKPAEVPLCPARPVEHPGRKRRVDETP